MQREGVNARQIYWGLTGLWSPSHPSSLQCWQSHSPSSSSLAAPSHQLCAADWPMTNTSGTGAAGAEKVQQMPLFSSHQILPSKLAEHFSPEGNLAAPGTPQPGFTPCTPDPKVSVWADWRGAEGRTCPSGQWWDCGHAEQPLICFHQGIILPILLHKSHIFCKKPSTWLPLACWCNTHPVL